MSQSVPFRCIFNQGPVLRSLLGAAVRVPGRTKPGAEAPRAPGPWMDRVVPPRSPALVKAYKSWTEAGAHTDGTLPPHFFPQWGVPVLARTLRDLPFPLSRILNQGCRITRHGTLPGDADLHVKGRLEATESNEERVRLHQRLVTGTAEQPDVLKCDVYVTVRLKRGARKSSRPAKVPEDAVTAGSRQLGSRAGLDFAMLTGDFNPIHWLGPAARAAGFERPILHGFALLAIASEQLDVFLSKEDGQPWREIDVRFVRPVVLPNTVALHVAGAHQEGAGELYVTNDEGTVCMTGSFHAAA